MTAAADSGQATDRQAAQGIALTDALGFLFRRLSSVADAAFLARSDVPDLTPMQMGALLTVERVSHLSVRALAREMLADRSTIQELVKRMVDRGLLDRRVSEQDRRLHELWVTDAGAAVVARNRGIVQDLQDDLLAPLTDAEGATLVALLRKLLAGHDAAAKGQSST